MTVTAAPVVEKPMPVAVDAIGTAEAFSVVAVHAQITGELTSVNFKDGDEVTKGQELFTLDRRPLEATLQQVQANLDRDVAQLANAKAQLQRYQDLSDRGIATREQLDQSRTTLAALEATTVADRASVENAKVQLAYATITAPLSGRVGKLLVSVGNLVRANDATPLVVINQVAPIYAVFGIPEAQLPDLKRYMARGTLRVEAAPHGVGISVGRSSGVCRQRRRSDDRHHRRKSDIPQRRSPAVARAVLNVTVTLDNDPAAIVVPTIAIRTVSGEDRLRRQTR